MEKSRIALLVIAIVAAIGCLGFMGVRAFCEKVYASRDCEWANIDNIEMHARIDIPATTDCDCEYDKNEAAKKVVFTLDKDAFDMTEYVRKHRFAKMEPDKPLHQSFGFAKDLAVNDKSKLYYRSNEESLKPDRDVYRMVLDPETGKMWVYLQYN